ncbi:BON domain-containing protein [Candidatus Nitrospira salsa]|nr:MAG: hypothetical protein NPIRA01_30640 [Nitrospirales bacterium]
MKFLRASTIMTTAFAIILSIVGIPGPALSQDGNYDYNFEPYNHLHYYEDEILSDRELRTRIMTALFMSSFVEDSRIDVSVDKGIATLSGIVENRKAMIDAEITAYDAGAWRVHNQLREPGMRDRSWSSRRDFELKEKIKDELTYSLFVNEDQINVNVQNGVATLYGGVENREEIADAIDNAYEAGAERVKSRLWIDPDLF